MEAEIGKHCAHKKQVRGVRPVQAQDVLAEIRLLVHMEKRLVSTQASVYIVYTCTARLVKAAVPMAVLGVRLVLNWVLLMLLYESDMDSNWDWGSHMDMKSQPVVEEAGAQERL